MSTQQQEARCIATGDRVRVGVSGLTGTVDRAFPRHDGTAHARVQPPGHRHEDTGMVLRVDDSAGRYAVMVYTDRDRLTHFFPVDELTREDDP